MLTLRDRFADAIEIANKNAKEHQNKSKNWYDRKARSRQFQTGEQVLMFLQISGKPLEAKFHGPFTVLQQIGPVDCMIATPGRRRAKRLVDVNLLKKYFSRSNNDPLDFQITIDVNNVVNNHVLETDFNTSLITETKNKCTEPLCTIQSTELIVEQQSEIDKLLEEFADMFDSKPGRTNLIKNQIELLPNTKPIRKAPYRHNPQKADWLHNHLQELKADGRIEQSDSCFSSPVILVPKSSGDFRMVCDYRGLTVYVNQLPCFHYQESMT